jgi:undecaprenyl-diphosphatase
MIPGVSRSGATIAGALLLRADTPAAAEFSFFLAIPTMVGAFAYDLYKSKDALSTDQAGLIAVGFVVAFLSGLLVVKTLIAFVGRHGFTPFGIWRIVVGAAGLFFLYR